MIRWPGWLSQRDRKILEAVRVYGDVCRTVGSRGDGSQTAAIRDVIRALGIQERPDVAAVADAFKRGDLPLTEKELSGTVVPFGKHKGMTLDKIPAKYLDWLLGQEWFEHKFDDLFAMVDAYVQLPHVQREIDDSDGEGSGYDPDYK